MNIVAKETRSFIAPCLFFCLFLVASRCLLHIVQLIVLASLYLVLASFDILGCPIFILSAASLCVILASFLAFNRRSAKICLYMVNYPFLEYCIICLIFFILIWNI